MEGAAINDGWILDSPTVFFQRRLREAFSRQRVEPSEAVEAYLVWLLERFLTARGDLLASPLGLAYLETRHDAPVARFGKFKSIADTALFVTGIFLESVESSACRVSALARDHDGEQRGRRRLEASHEVEVHSCEQVGER